MGTQTSLPVSNYKIDLLIEASYEGIDVVQMTRRVRNLRPTGARDTGLRVAVRQAGGLVQGALGAEFLPDQSGQLLIMALVADEAASGLDRSLAKRALEGAMSVPEIDRLGAGVLTFDRALLPNADITPEMVTWMAGAVVKLFAFGGGELPDEKLAQLLDLPPIDRDAMPAFAWESIPSEDIDTGPLTFKVDDVEPPGKQVVMEAPQVVDDPSQIRTSELSALPVVSESELDDVAEPAPHPPIFEEVTTKPESFVFEELPSEPESLVFEDAFPEMEAPEAAPEIEWASAPEIEPELEEPTAEMEPLTGDEDLDTARAARLAKLERLAELERQVTEGQVVKTSPEGEELSETSTYELDSDDLENGAREAAMLLADKGIAMDMGPVSAEDIPSRVRGDARDYVNGTIDDMVAKTHRGDTQVPPPRKRSAVEEYVDRVVTDLVNGDEVEDEQAVASAPVDTSELDAQPLTDDDLDQLLIALRQDGDAEDAAARGEPESLVPGLEEAPPEDSVSLDDLLPVFDDMPPSMHDNWLEGALGETIEEVDDAEVEEIFSNLQDASEVIAADEAERTEDIVTSELGGVIPEWLQSLEDDEETPAAPEEMPEEEAPVVDDFDPLSRLQEMVAPAAEEADTLAAVSKTDSSSMIDTDLLDIFEEVVSEPQEAFELPDLFGSETSRAAEADTDSMRETGELDVPDWLDDAAGEAPEEDLSWMLEPDGGEEGESPEWLEEVFVAPEDDSDAEAIESLLKQVGTQEQDASEDLPSLPDDAPDWLKEAAVADSVPAEEDVVTSPLSAAAPDWLVEVPASDSEPIEDEKAVPPVEYDAPDWLKEAAAADSAPVEEEQEVLPVAEEPEEPLPAWLSESAEPTLEPEPEAEPAEEILAEEEGLPAWLQEPAGVPARVEKTASPAPEPSAGESLPAWLQSPESEKAEGTLPAGEGATRYNFPPPTYTRRIGSSEVVFYMCLSCGQYTASQQAPNRYKCNLCGAVVEYDLSTSGNDDAEPSAE